MEIYQVGGAVRDKLLGLPIIERDWVVVGQTPEALLKAGFKKVGKDFPVFLHPETQEEYALARTERKIGPGYYGFSCVFDPAVTLEEDLSRRDLTINAMAETLEGRIIDPYQGQQDLNHKILRHVSPAFSEDPVRLLRVARFAARFSGLGFTVAPETLALMRDMVQAGEIASLVPERVWQEILRALKEPNPVPFFLVLRECGALEHLWPALNKLWGIPQPAQHHPEIDTGIHVMMALQYACQKTPDLITRFAVLCHDLGKGETPPREWPSHRGHEERGVPLITQFSARYRIPVAYKELAILVSRFHLHCHRAFELRADTLLKTLERLDAFRSPERFQKFLWACEADARGRTGKESVPYPQVNWMWAAYEAAKAVDIAPLLAKGLTGAALGAELHQKRIVAIQNLKSVTTIV